MKTVVLALLALLPVTPQGSGRMSCEVSARADMQTLKTCLMVFEAQNGRPPTAQEGLRALVRNPDPANLPHWHHGLDQIPNDAWGHPYQYIPLGAGGLRPYGIYSFGPDGFSRSNGDDPDDLNTWNPKQPPIITRENDPRLFLALAGVAGILFLILRLARLARGGRGQVVNHQT